MVLVFSLSSHFRTGLYQVYQAVELVMEINWGIMEM